MPAVDAPGRSQNALSFALLEQSFEAPQQPRIDDIGKLAGVLGVGAVQHAIDVEEDDFHDANS